MHELARPFHFHHDPPSHSAILLTHGFTSTPFAMRELGRILYEAGHDTQGLLLPGHGTVPEDLHSVRHSDWIHAVYNAAQSLRKRYARVFLCGQSLGGCLSLLVSTLTPVDGIVTISAGYRLSWWKVLGVRLQSTWKPFIRKEDGPGIRDPEAKQTEIHYDRMSSHAILELNQVLTAMRGRLRYVTSPLLLIHAKEDHTFPRAHQDRIARAVASRRVERILLPRSYHVATLDVDKQQIHDGARTFLQSLTYDSPPLISR